MLEVRDLCRPGIVPGLDHATFAVAAGRCIVVQGASGSGKTMLLRAIADLDVNTGRVMLDGVDRDAVPGPEWRRRAVYVPAEPGWWATTVRDHFADWPAALPLAVALLLPADIGDWPVERLSTGERQRLAVIRALVLAPRLLLLDEPTAALDPAAAEAVEAAVARHLGGGAAALWVTHDTAQAARIADTVLHVDRGRVSFGAVLT